MANGRYINEQLPQNQSALLGSVLKGVRRENVYPCTSIDVLGIFAQTCQKAEAETAFPRLLIAAVGAKPESYNQEDETKLAAIAILKRHPELLFDKGMVTDHFGRKIFASPYQLFLGTGDVWALKQVHDEILPNIEGGAAKARQQYIEQFPNPVCALAGFTQEDLAVLKSLKVENEDLQAKIQSISDQDEEYKSVRFEKNDFIDLHQLLSENNREDLCTKLYAADICHDDRNIAQIEQVKETLKKVVTAISADPCTNSLATLDATKIAVAELCQLFMPKEGEVIRTGLHFPLAILQEIFRVYDAQFDPWTGAKLAFFSREVIGAALAASTVVDGQAYKHGLSKMDFEKGPDRRDGLFCRHPKGIPAELAPLSDKYKLGRTMFVDPYDGESCFQSDTLGYFVSYNKNGGVRRGEMGRIGCRAGLAKLMSNKKSELAQLICGNPKPRPEPMPSRCLIC